MRRTSILLLLLLFSAHELGAGFLPKRRAPRKPTQSGASFNYRTQRGPTYSPAQQGSFSADEVQNLIQESNSPLNQIAQEAVGIGGGGGSSCDSAIARLNAINAELNSILVQLQAAQASLSGCGLNTSCISYWGNRAIALGTQATTYQSELQSLSSQLQACQAKGGGGSQTATQAMPPGITYANLAKRLKASPPASGGGSSGGFSSQAYDDLEEDVLNSRIPDYDGRGRAQSKALGKYQRAAMAASQIGARVDAGRDFAGKPARDFSDPSAAARQEYLRINYEVLGPKYEKLAQQRSETADAFAREVLASEPALPLPSDEPPLIRMDEGAQGLSQQFFESGAEELNTGIEDLMTKHLDLRGKAFLGIAKIEMSLFEGLQELAKKLPAAIAQMGSASLNSDSINEWLSAGKKAQGDVLGVSQQAVSDLAGGNPNPSEAAKSSLRDWLKNKLKGNNAD